MVRLRSCLDWGSGDSDPKYHMRICRTSIRGSKGVVEDENVSGSACLIEAVIETDALHLHMLSQLAALVCFDTKSLLSVHF
jgi:hypothetical protein